VGKVIRLGANTGSGGGMLVIAPNGETAYVLAAGSSTKPGLVIPVHLATGSVGKPIPVGRNAFELAIAPGGSALYVLDSGIDDGAGSPENTAGALVTVATATGAAGRPVATGLASAAFAFAPLSGPASTLPPPPGAKDLVVTATVESQLVAAFAPAHHVARSEVAGTFPGSVYYAYDPATKTYWAEASFVPARGDTASVANTFQDAGSDGVFSRSATGPWRFLGAGVPLTCVRERYVPKAVAAVWGLPASSPSCPPA
jgi:hypothetical protein